MSESTNMTFGPVQMLVVGFAGTEFTGEIMAELTRLKEADIVLSLIHISEPTRP